MFYYSLKKEYTIPNILSIVQKVTPLYIQPKIDGFSVILHYQNGELSSVESKSSKKLLRGLVFPDILNDSFTGWIRGEMIVDPEAFSQYNYKQNRRGAYELYKKGQVEHLQYIVFDTSYGQTFLEKYEFCQKLGFDVIPTGSIAENRRGEAELRELFQKWFATYSEKYPLDGTVLLSDTDFLDTDEKQYSQSRIAYKEIQDIYKVEIQRVEKHTNRFEKDGYVAFFSPIEDKEGMIQSVTLYRPVKPGEKVKIGIVPGSLNVVEVE